MKEKKRKDFMKVKSVKTNRLFFLAFYDALHVKTQEKDLLSLQMLSSYDLRGHR